MMMWFSGGLLPRLDMCWWASLRQGSQVEHQDYGVSVPEPPDSTKSHLLSSLAFRGPPKHFACCVGMTLWHRAPMSLHIGGFVSVWSLSYSILEPVMLAEKVEL